MTYRQAQLAAAAAAQRRRVIRRRAIAGGTLVAAVVIVVAFSLFGGGNKKKTKVATTGTTTSTTTAASTTAAASAAGKPCVAVSGPLPSGAPNVPVPIGPPPAQLVKQDIKAGTGAEITTANANVTVQYIGVSCSTGKIFDSSWQRGQPTSFPLSGVIPGWQQGMLGMKVGGERLLGIPPNLGYGSRGAAPDIAPDETLWFVIDLVDVKPG
jgi:peptidylprolyl isomerase